MKTRTAILGGRFGGIYTYPMLHEVAEQLGAYAEKELAARGVESG
jgi:hypothetical protein